MKFWFIFKNNYQTNEFLRKIVGYISWPFIMMREGETGLKMTSIYGSRQLYKILKLIIKYLYYLRVKTLEYFLKLSVL